MQTKLRISQPCFVTIAWLVALWLCWAVETGYAAQITLSVVNATSCTLLDKGQYPYTGHFQIGWKNNGAYSDRLFGTLLPGEEKSMTTTDYSLGSWKDEYYCGEQRVPVGSGAARFILTPCGACSDAPLRDRLDAGDNPLCEGGMPQWSVSMPFVSLWLHDEPIGYQPAIGPRVSFRLAYKQREEFAGMTNHIFAVGRKWNCEWLSYIRKDSKQDNAVYLNSGRVITFQNSVPSATDYFTGSKLTGNTSSGFTLTFPDGSKTVYGFVVTNSNGSFQYAFMSEAWNAIGQRTRFTYHSYTPGNNPVIRLKEVIDGDGRTNTVSYVTNNAYSTNLISEVTDPFGRTTTLAHDHLGRLTNVVDVAGLPSSFVYGSNDWVTNLITPYGTNFFAYTDSTGTNVAPSGRSVLIAEPDGSKQLYLGRDYAPGVASSYGTGEIPVTTPAYTNFFENSRLDRRNTFHWGRRQYAALSTTNLALLTTNDFRKARMQHWLFGETLSLVREPSPDNAGTIEGQKTWYDYAGKVKENYLGAQPAPLFVARVLPDGTSSFVRTERNDLSFVTREISTYSSNSVVALSTNIYTYAANLIDLITVTNALGVRVSSNSYNAYHQVLTNFNALNEKTVFTYDTSNRLSRIIHPTGLITTNIYGADKFLAEQRIVGFSTNFFTYSNDLVLTHTDARGLTVTNTYDALQRLRRVSFPDGTFITNIYDKLDLVRTIDRMGYSNSFGFNAVRQLVAATNALGFYNLYDYCSCGSLNSVRDAANRYTWFFYDNAGRQTNVVYADGYAVTNYYNLVGQLTNVVDSAGTSVTNWFNNQGLLVTSSNVLGGISAVIFDALDRATNTVDANGVTLTTTHDNLNRPLTTTYPDGGVERWAYTANFAAATSYTNQLGTNVVNYTYDLLGRKTNEVYPGLMTNKFAYSGAGDLKTLIDGKNQITTWNYDEYGRATNKVDATSTEIFRYSFDPNGRLTNRWTAAKGITVYRYDALGNLTNVDYAVSPDLTMQ